MSANSPPPPIRRGEGWLVVNHSKLAQTHKLVEGVPKFPPGDTRKTVIPPDPKPSVIKIRRGGGTVSWGEGSVWCRSEIDVVSIWNRSENDLN